MRICFKGLQIGKLIITTTNQIQDGNFRLNTDELSYLYKKAIKDKILNK